VITCNYTGNSTRFVQFNHTFTDTYYGEINVTAAASNGIMTATKTFTIVVFHKINGISINTSKSSYETLEDAEIVLQVAETALQPQGLVNGTIDFGNGNMTDFVLAANETSLIPYLTFTQQYAIQGNYTVEMVFSAYNNTVNETLDVQIWDELAVNLSSVTQTKVDIEIEFSFGSTPRSNFMYHISFGDGTDAQNQESDLYREYDIKAWNKSYTQPGIFNVSMTAWNPVYTSVFSYLITVTQGR
jgi:hypothetical protein